LHPEDGGDVPPKLGVLPGLHGVTAQNIVLVIVTAVRTSEQRTENLFRPTSTSGRIRRELQNASEDEGKGDGIRAHTTKAHTNIPHRKKPLS
jgi:hypothetical protein